MYSKKKLSKFVAKILVSSSMNLFYVGLCCCYIDA